MPQGVSRNGRGRRSLRCRGRRRVLRVGGDLWGGPGPQRGVRRLDGQLPNLGPRWVRRPPLLNKSRRSEHAQPPTFHSPLPNRPSAKRALTQRGPTHRRFFRERWGSAVTYGSEVPAGILKVELQTSCQNDFFKAQTCRTLWPQDSARGN